MALPIERFKESYVNRRHNPFTDADMAVDKEEDNLYIPGSAPYVIQLLEQPRKNDPTSITVYCYDDVAFLTEVAGAPAQGEFRVDYPPDDGEGTGLVEFNNLDAGKEVRFNYKATGSPVLAEFSDTKVSFPAGAPDDNQIIGFVSGAPGWRNNRICMFHEGPVVYHTSGEDESCLLFRFKKTAQEGKVYLELKGAKLHQALYTELLQHNHAEGTLVNAAAPTHTHGVGTYSIPAAPNHGHGKGTYAADAVAAHSHAKGTLIGTQPNHEHTAGTLVNAGAADHAHAKGTLAGSQPTHQHGVGTLGNAAAPDHTHLKGTLAGSQPTHQHTDGTLAGSQATHTHTITGDMDNTGLAHTHVAGTLSGDNHGHPIAGRSHQHTYTPGTQTPGLTSLVNGCDTPTSNSGVTISGSTGDWSIANLHRHTKGTLAIAAAGDQAVSITGSVAAGGDDAVTIAGSTANAGAHNHTISGNVAASGNDAVAIAGNTANAGAHNHVITGNVAGEGNDNVTIVGNMATAGAHGHVISGTSADAGAHNHTMAGSSAAGGNHNHVITGNVANTGVTPKTYPDALKVYINSVDKTADLLALTALAAFGDGTAGHAFVTTGSGEMDISALVAANQFHELKITEPTNGEGGRVLLHLELN